MKLKLNKGAIKAYQMHLKEKTIRKKNKIAMLKRQQKHCPDWDIGFLTDEKLKLHIKTIHTEDKDYMLRIAKDYNDKLQEDDEEEKEEIKDLVHETHSKIEDTIKREINDLKFNLNDAKRRDDELSRLQSKLEIEERKRQEEKHYATELLNDNNSMLQKTSTNILSNFEKKLKEMFDHVNETLEKDEEEERQKDDIMRKRENELLKKIDKKNEEINRLKVNYEEAKQLTLRSSGQDFSNTFERIDKSKGIIGMAASSRAMMKQIEKEKQDKELTLMEAEDLRMKQIWLEEKRIRELKQLEEKLQIEANKKLELELLKRSKINEKRSKNFRRENSNKSRREKVERVRWTWSKKKRKRR